jgi:hypothetical protein
MALEEAYQNAAECGGRVLLRRTTTWCGSLRWVKHHVFPRAKDLAPKFRELFGDVDKYTLRVPDWYNKWVHSCGQRGGFWNDRWRKFFAEHENPSPYDALNYLKQLLRETGLEDVKMSELQPYRGKCPGVINRILEYFGGR